MFIALDCSVDLMAHLYALDTIEKNHSSLNQMKSM